MSVTKEELVSLSTESPTGKFALGLYETLEPAVAQCDETIRSVVESQRGVLASIDRLSDELSAFEGESKSPSLLVYVDKVSVARQKIIKINTKMRVIHNRLENIRSSVRRQNQARRARGLPEMRPRHSVDATAPSVSASSPQQSGPASSASSSPSTGGVSSSAPTGSQPPSNVPASSSDAQTNPSLSLSSESKSSESDSNTGGTSPQEESTPKPLLHSTASGREIGQLDARSVKELLDWENV